MRSIAADDPDAEVTCERDVPTASSPKLVRRSFMALGYGRIAGMVQAETSAGWVL
jgi:hypothetical protein